MLTRGLILALMAFVSWSPARAVVHASLLIDAQTGKVLSEYNADQRAHPASLTKLMTLYITFQRLADGRLTLDQELRVSRHAADQQPTRLDLRPGSTVTVRTCILGIVSHSANDAAVVLAENIAGSETRFAQMMNQEARTLGMTRTVFSNASGLPVPNQWTTARDMADLADAILHTFPQYYHFFDTRSFYFHGRTYYSFDHLPEEYPGADGMKTGYIASSGFNIVTSAVRDHRRVIGVVLGGATARTRDLQMISLLNSGFAAPSRPALLVASATVPRPGVVRRRAFHVDLASMNIHPTPRRRSGWMIQLGSGFRSSWEAHRVLRSARLSAPFYLRRGRAMIVRLRYRGYQARITDLSRERAFEACSTLHRKRFTCSAMPQLPKLQHLADARIETSGAGE